MPDVSIFRKPGRRAHSMKDPLKGFTLPTFSPAIPPVNIPRNGRVALEASLATDLSTCGGTLNGGLVINSGGVISPQLGVTIGQAQTIDFTLDAGEGPAELAGHKVYLACLVYVNAAPLPILAGSTNAVSFDLVA